MEEINQIIKILTAFTKGEQLQYHSGKYWRDFDGDISYLLSTITGLGWRIKPESVYRPYANKEEFLKASKEHGPYFKDDTNCLFFPIYITDEYIETKEWKLSYEQMSRDCATVWQDGTPLAMLED